MEHAAQHATEHPASHDHIVSPKIYVGIWLLLMMMTAVTVGVALLDLGRLNVVVALVIAVFKATLVVLYFMHVKYSTRLTQLVIACGFFWLLILLLLTQVDLLTRGWMQVPGR